MMKAAQEGFFLSGWQTLRTDLDRVVAEEMGGVGGVESSGGVDWAVLGSQPR